LSRGFRDQDSGFRDQDSGFRDQDSGFRDQDSGIRIQKEKTDKGGSSVVPPFDRFFLSIGLII